MGYIIFRSRSVGHKTVEQSSTVGLYYGKNVVLKKDGTCT